MFKQLFIMLCTLMIVGTQLPAKFQPWTERLLSLTYQMDENNMTDERVQEIAKKETAFYNEILEDILLRKTDFLYKPIKFEFDIGHL